MIDENKKPFEPKVYLLLFIAGLTASLFVHSEIGLLYLFIISLGWHILAGHGSSILGYIFSYAILWGITKLALLGVEANPTGTIAISISNIGMMGRRAIVPLLFAVIIGRLHTGSLMASLSTLGLPKAVGIGLAAMLRFFPTIKEEARHIRNAQKFRGIGVGFWGTITHLPQVINYVYIPLIIRITKISEDLSASVTVRGVGFNSEIVSFRPTKFTCRDTAFLIVTVMAFIAVGAFDMLYWR